MMPIPRSHEPTVDITGFGVCDSPRGKPRVKLSEDCLAVAPTATLSETLIWSRPLPEIRRTGHLVDHGRRRVNDIRLP